MHADIIVCENTGPALRLSHHAANRCPCCGKKDFEVLAENITVEKAFAIFAKDALERDPDAFSRMVKETVSQSEGDY